MKYFITYGDNQYEKSKVRLAAEVQNTGYFDTVIAYGREDVGTEISQSPLFSCEKGGGYWIWKPYIVLKTFSMMQKGDILVYADAGCSAYRHKEWERYFSVLDKYSALTFMLPLKCETFTKQAIVQHYAEIGRNWEKRFQIAAGFFLVRKNEQMEHFFREWLDIMLERPDLVLDVPETEMHYESRSFKGHRHDQSLFTAITYKYLDQFNIKLLFNHFEGGIDRFRGQALVADRISDTNRRSSRKRSLVKSSLYYLLALPYRSLYHQYQMRKK